jgi:hypothetical protein
MRFRWLVLICILLLLVYGVSPYFSFWRFRAALRSGDSAALSSRMDFPAIRASLKKQLVARFTQGTTGHKWWNDLGPTLIDAIVDAYVTPEGIAVLISNPDVLKSLKQPQQFRFPTGKAEDWSKVKYAFFTGSRTFVVERDGIKLRFRFTGSGWKLYDLDLGLGEAKPIVLHKRNRSLNDTEREIALWKQTVLYAQICEDSQTFLFLFLKPESKMFGVVVPEEFAIDSPPLAGVGDPGYDFRDQVVEISKVCIAQSAQRVCDLFWIGDFGANKPERVNERQVEKFLPLFAKIPERKFVSVLLSDVNSLITDEKLRATDRS